MIMVSKSSNVTRNKSSNNWENYSQYSEGTNSLGSTGFNESMPKLVQGVSCLQANGNLKIYIFYKSDAGYDIVTNVIDTSLKPVISFNDSTCGKSSISLTYKNFRRIKSSHFSLTLVFASGSTKIINLKVPGKNSQLNSDVDNVTSVLTESPYQNLLSVDLKNDVSSNSIITKLYKISDPYNLYNYAGIIKQNLPFAYYINSETLNEVFVDAGVTSSNPNVDNGISTRGVGSLHGGSEHQEIHFITIIGDESIENSEQFNNSLESNLFTSGFIYAENLYNIPDEAPTYYVCLNEGESSYYRTSGTDCNGAAIDADYSSGKKPARFLDGQCCNTLCDDFSISITNTSPKDAYLNNDAKGSIKISVSGGTADYTYAVTTQGSAITNYITSPTVSSDQSEYEFTGINLKDALEFPFKVTVTDANGCSKIAYIQLDQNVLQREGSILGCTDTSAINYDSGADQNSGCLWCIASGPRGESYNGLGFGLSSSTQIRALGVDLISAQSTKITHATASGNSDGKIFFRGEVLPAAESAVLTDSDATYRIRRFNLGNTENSNNLTDGEVLASGAESTNASLTSPILELGSLAPGWYAFAVDIQDLPAAANCISVYRFKVGHGGCTDLEASNYDGFADYNNSTCTYDCAGTTENITVSDTNNACVKTVSVLKAQKNEIINWRIGERSATGSGPHVAAAEEYVKVYRENSKTRCSSSGEIFIDGTDCLLERGSPEFGSIASRMGIGTLFFDTVDVFGAVNSGGCTDEAAFNYDCDALYDNNTCTEVIYGCTSNTATNYDPNANVDNGSCFEGIEGCCDPVSPNYNPLANICTGCLDATGLQGQGTLTGAQVLSIGPPCNTDPATIDISATSNQLVIESLFFGSNSGAVVYLPAGVVIKAYLIPVGGLTIEEYSVNDISFPLEGSGWPVAAEWILTGDGAPNQVALDDDGELTYNSNGDAIGVTVNVTSLSLSNTTFVATSGTIGYGAYILEITVPTLSSGVYYGRTFVNAPLNNSSFCDHTIIDGWGSRKLGCVDPTASNYNARATLTPFAANNVGYNGLFFMDVIGFSPYSADSVDVSNVADMNTDPGGDGPYADYLCQHNYNIPCIPPNMYRKLKYIDKCIHNGSVNWFNNLITGRETRVEEKKLSIMSMIRYLLDRQGLECVFNCSDSGTKDYSQVLTCKEKWEASGSISWDYNTVTGLTNIDQYTNQIIQVNSATTPNWMGDSVVDTYWEIQRIGSTDPITTYNYALASTSYTFNPYGLMESQKGFALFQQCRDQKIITKNVNYLDNFFKFASKYCDNCGPCSYNSKNKTSFIAQTPKIITGTNISDSTSLSIGGISLTIDDEDYN